MQDDKTTSSQVTTKHRNSSRNSRRINETVDALLTVPSSDSTNSGMSNRRMMRLSEKMTFVKQRRSGTMSPTTVDPQTPSSITGSSPTYSVKKKNKNFDRFSNNAEDPDNKVEDAQYAEEDVESEFLNQIESNGNSSSRSGEGEVGRDEEMETMDRIESRRYEGRGETFSFLAKPRFLEGVPEEERGPEEKKEEELNAERKGPGRHQRTPGGAAAKLMLMGPHDSAEDELPTPRPSPDSSTGSEKQNLLQAALDHARKQAKSQFNMRPVSASHAEVNKNEEPVDMEVYCKKLAKESPHLFDRKQVFYTSASAAMSALQTARSFAPNDSQSAYSRSTYGGTLSYNASDAQSVAASVTSAFQVTDGDETNLNDSYPRKDVADELMSTRARMLVESLPDEMQYPNATLAHLLQNIASAPEGDIPDLGYTVRRKNACGALQVLTAQPSNRIALAWTIGVLPALTSVLSDTGSEGLIATYPDKRHRHEFEVACNRAISCLVNLATPKENRIAIFHSPDLVHWLVAMILEGRGQPRKGACAVFAYLAKTPDNRLLMVQVPRLIEALTKVLKRRPPRLEFLPETQKQSSESSQHSESEDEDSATDGGHTQVTGSTARVTERDDTRTEATDDENTAQSSRRVDKTESVLSEPSRFMAVSSSYSNQSGATQRLAGARSPVELQSYDETADELLREARNYAFATLSNLVKEKDNAFHFARDTVLIKTMSEIACCHDSKAHEHAVKFLTSLTRHRMNSKTLVFRRRTVVPALVEATSSPNEIARLYACYGLQNLSQDKSCRQELAIAENLLVSLCERARGATEQEAERLAALSALKNLTDEPANLIPMSNTTDCIATLMHLAHGRQEGVTPLMQYRACDALATLSHWLRKIATSGQALTDAKMGRNPNKELFVPSLRVVSVNQWQ